MCFFPPTEWFRIKMDNPNKINQIHLEWLICRHLVVVNCGIGPGTLPGRFPTMPPVLVPHATSPAASKATAPTVSPGTLQGTDGTWGEFRGDDLNSQ